MASNVISLEEPQSLDSHRHRNQSEGRSSNQRFTNIHNTGENVNDDESERQRSGNTEKTIEDQTRESRQGRNDNNPIPVARPHTARQTSGAPVIVILFCSNSVAIAATVTNTIPR